jgi:hypothetical protein
MKSPQCLALLALLPLGCGGAVPAATEPTVVATTQRPAEIVVVDLSPPAPKAVAPAKAAEAPKPPEDDAQKAAAEFGLIGVLGSGAGVDPSASTWVKDHDPLSAPGNMWGDSIGDSFGVGGLGLAGTGLSAGGMGQGIGLGGIGTLGHGAGTGTGQSYGSGSGRLGGSPGAKPPQVRMGATTVVGKLPPEIIQRIVRQNFGRFRLCYENGLRTNPTLEGNVTVRFLIEKTGAVSGVAAVKGTDLADKTVASCVIRAFTALSFPEPEGGGKVMVTYPIKFAPGEPAPAAPPAVKAPPAPKSP